MSLESFFDKIFVINLDRRTDRWQACLEEFACYKITKFERFRGYPHPTNGHQGCTRSHRELLRKLAVGPWERVLVLEDDFHVLTLKDLQDGGFIPESDVMKTFLSAPGGLHRRFDYMVQFVPADWDVLYLGGGYGGPPITRVHRHVVRCGAMMTTSSYGITKQFAQIWTEGVDAMVRQQAEAAGTDLLESHPGPIDLTFSRFAAERQFYVFQPRLMIQRPSFSDLTERDEHYLMSMTDPNHEQMV